MLAGYPKDKIGEVKEVDFSNISKSLMSSIFNYLCIDSINHDSW
jgi:hypothetical protein